MSMSTIRALPQHGKIACQQQERIFSLRFCLLWLCLAAQVSSVPFTAVGGISWAVWPTVFDVCWLVLVLSYVPKLRMPQQGWTSEVLYGDVALLVYFVCATLVGYARHESLMGILYAGYILARMFQAVTLWYIASQITLSKKQFGYLIVALILPGVLNAIIANLQGVGLLGFRPFVSHLPATVAAGPWAARVLAEESFSLGILGYNRIYVGVQLVIHSIVVLALMRKSFLAYFLLAVNLSAVLWTGSRTALLFLAVATLIVIIINRQRAVLVILGFIAAVAIGSTSDLAWQMRRGLLMGGETLAESTAGRFEVQSIGFRVFSESILNSVIGCGPGHLGLYNDTMGFYQAHSQYIQVLSEYGVVGLLLWTVWYWKRISVLTRRSYFYTPALAVFVGLATAAAFNDFLLPNPAFGSLVSFLFILLGLGCNSSVSQEALLRCRQGATQLVMGRVT